MEEIKIKGIKINEEYPFPHKRLISGDFVVVVVFLFYHNMFKEFVDKINSNPIAFRKNKHVVGVLCFKKITIYHKVDFYKKMLEIFGPIFFRNLRIEEKSLLDLFCQNGYSGHLYNPIISFLCENFPEMITKTTESLVEKNKSKKKIIDKFIEKKICRNCGTKDSKIYLKHVCCCKDSLICIKCINILNDVFSGVCTSCLTEFKYAPLVNFFYEDKLYVDMIKKKFSYFILTDLDSVIITLNPDFLSKYLNETDPESIYNGLMIKSNIFSISSYDEHSCIRHCIKINVDEIKDMFDIDFPDIHLINNNVMKMELLLELYLEEIYNKNNLPRILRNERPIVLTE